MSTATMNVAGMNVAEMLRLGKTATIASIFPLDQSITRKFRTRQNGGHLHIYSLPACEDPDNPTLLLIGDAMELHFLGTDPYSNQKRMEETPVPGGATQIAEDFIQNTRRAAAGAEDMKACPGIWICAGDKPSREEIEAAKRWQRNYFLKLQIEADDKWFAGQKDFVGSLHRLAATWLKLDPRKHEWMRDAQIGDTKECPFCQSVIGASAIKCMKCNEIVDPQRYAEHKRLMDEAMASLAAEGVAAPATIVAPVKPQPGQPIHAPIRK